MIKQYLFNLFVVCSCFLNTLLGGFPKEALSERSGRVYLSKGEFWLRDFINWLFFWESNHCENSLLEEKAVEVWDWIE